MIHPQYPIVVTKALYSKHLLLVPRALRLKQVPHHPLANPGLFSGVEIGLPIFNVNKEIPKQKGRRAALSAQVNQYSRYSLAVTLNFSSPTLLT